MMIFYFCYYIMFTSWLKKQNSKQVDIFEAIKSNKQGVRQEKPLLNIKEIHHQKKKAKKKKTNSPKKNKKNPKNRYSALSPMKI